MAEVDLIVNGLRYFGWKSARITRSIEGLAGSFALDVSDRWNGIDKPWPIRWGDRCRVEIDGVQVIDGYVDKPSISATSNARTLAYTGRDRAAALVDCSAVLKQWTYRNVTVADFVSTIAKPFGVAVSVQSGLTLPKVPKIVVSPGDTAYEAIKRAAGDDGVLIVSDGAGGALLTRAGTERAYSLVEGANIKEASVDYDGSERYYRYVIATQVGGTDAASGNATRIQAEAIDQGVTRTDRVLLIRPDKGYSVADARRRADWEARVRAAKAETVKITVQGWRQGNGVLWPVNAITHVTAPRMIGVDADMLISQVEYSIGSSGELAQLSLVRPDAFEPEPKALVKGGGGSGLWAELANGGR